MSDHKHDEPNKHDSISIIYHQRNDSPKYFEIKRTKVYLFFIGLPAITLIALVLGGIGLMNTSPINMLEDYRQKSAANKVDSKYYELQESVQNAVMENSKLKDEISALQDQAKSGTKTDLTTPNPVKGNDDLKCPAPVVCPNPTVSGTINSIGLSTLSLFRPIQGQKDRTRPAVLTLSGFKTATMRDTVNLQFNIIPNAADDAKISGHIIVLMKNELGIQAYPLQTFGGNDFQINYAAGEPFSTQRFRPVDASFVKPRKAGNYSFTVFIFSRTGDLLHFQTVNQIVKL